MIARTAGPGRAPAFHHVVLRAALATALLLVAAQFHSRDAVGVLLPGLSKALAWVADDFEIISVEFVTERNSLNIAALARLAHVVVLGGRAIVPDGQALLIAATTVGTVLQPLLVALVLVLAWPARLPEMALRLLMAAVLLALVLLIDTPFSLAAGLWDAQLRQYAPGHASPLVWWHIFLSGGGRLALGLVAGAVAIALARRGMRSSQCFGSDSR